MIRGVYSAAAGMIANFRRQTVITNNVTNISTTGFKQELTEVLAGPDMQVFDDRGTRGGNPSNVAPLGLVGMGARAAQVGLDLAQGDLAETGNPLDVAITGPGFLAVETPTGVRYTRDGTLFRDAEGQLARADGGLVLGDTGPIVVGQGDVLIDGDGTVTVDGEVAGRIGLFELAGPLDKVGNNYVVPQGVAPTPSQGSQLNQGFLEKSNVDVSKAMVDMMAVSRLYEASQRMVMLQDQTLEKAVNEVGKV